MIVESPAESPLTMFSMHTRGLSPVAAGAHFWKRIHRPARRDVEQGGYHVCHWASRTIPS